MSETKTIRALVEDHLRADPNLTYKQAFELYGVGNGNFYEYRRQLFNKPTKKKTKPFVAKPVDFEAILPEMGKGRGTTLQDNYLPPKAEPKPVKAILQDRQKTYGDFKDVANTTHNIMNTLASARMTTGDLGSVVQLEALHMISSKLARIVNGDPSFVDSWRDIAGYATLVVDHLEAK